MKNPPLALLFSCVSLFVFSAAAPAQVAFAPLEQLAGPAGIDPVETVASDLDMDGDLDVLTGFSAGHGLSWIENLGGGHYAPAVPIGPGVDECSGVTAGDMDGDGDPDIVVSAFGSNTVVWYENLGGAEFSSPRLIGAGQLNDPRDAELGDVDGDGLVDVVIASRGNRIWWAENLGGGVFAATLHLINDEFGSDPGIVFPGDFDGDGDMDIANCNGQYGLVRVFLNGGGGLSWTMLTHNPDPNFVANGFNFDGGDLDGDGHYDLVLSVNSSLGREILVYSHAATGLSSPTRIANAGPNYAGGVALHDFDGDGLEDLLLGGSELHLRRHLGGLVFDGRIALSGVGFSGSPVAADVTGDGVVDALAISRSDSGSVHVVPFMGGGTFGTSIDIGQSKVQSPRGSVTFDLDGDGDLDVFCAVDSSGEVIRIENRGNGTFGPPRALTDSIAGATLLRAVDFDVDGDTDLLVAGDPNVWVLENLGGTDFAPAAVLAATSSACTGIHSDDLDLDGVPDLIYSVGNAGLLATRRGLGGGSFGVEVPVTTAGPSPYGIGTGDLDGDGDPEIVAAVRAGHSDGQVEAFDNLGAAGFGPPEVLMGGDPFHMEGARDVRVIDVTGDGMPDVFGVDYDSLRVVRNTGGGTFGPVEWLTSGNAPARAFDVADVDGDGHMDVVYAVYRFSGAKEIRFRRGSSSASFGPAELVSDLPEYVFDVHLADLDGDGDSDVISSSGHDDVLGWVEVLGTPPGGIGTSYCGPAALNSTGAAAAMAMRGSTSAAINDLELMASDLPRLSIGYFVGSQSQGFAAAPGGSQGNLCLGGSIARFIDSAETAGADGEIRYHVDLASVPLSPVVAVQAGESWSFQLWYRDANPQPTSNFTDGVELLFD